MSNCDRLKGAGEQVFGYLPYEFINDMKLYTKIFPAKYCSGRYLATSEKRIRNSRKDIYYTFKKKKEYINEKTNR